MGPTEEKYNRVVEERDAARAEAAAMRRVLAPFAHGDEIEHVEDGPCGCFECHGLECWKCHSSGYVLPGREWVQGVTLCNDCALACVDAVLVALAPDAGRPLLARMEKLEKVAEAARMLAVGIKEAQSGFSAWLEHNGHTHDCWDIPDPMDGQDEFGEAIAALDMVKP